MTDTSIATRVHDVLTQYLELNVKQDEWDQGPGLAILTLDGDDVLHIDGLSLPDDVWTSAPVWVVLNLVGQGLENNPMVITEDIGEVVAVALFVEGWGMRPGDKAEGKEAEAWTESGRKLADHPRAVEVKMASAAVTDGRDLSINYFRGDDSITEPDPGTNIAGRVPDALRRILTAITEKQH